MRGIRHVYMNEAPSDGGGAGSGGAAGAAAPGGEPAAAAPAGVGAAPGAPGATPAPSPAPAASALSAGLGAEGGDGGADPGAAPIPFAERVPEKFRVKREDGTLDIEATAAKVEEHRANLEKRLGSGDIRPKTAADYKLPPLPKEIEDMPVDDESTAKFREDAHAMGLSQAQFEGVMKRYYEMAPMLVNAGQQHSAESTVATLKEAWGAQYEANARAAWRGVTQIAQIAGLTTDQVEAELGNSPAFNRIMAAVGQQLREDRSVNPGPASGAGGGEAEAARLQASEAFRNERHPEHAATVAKWNSIVTAGVVDAPVV